MIRWTLFALLVTAALAADSQAPAPARLNLVVVEGEGAINNIKQRTARDTIVQVEDENHRPIAGAAVVFLLPSDGPGGSFVGGAKTAALVTDANGQAVMPRLEPNQLNGQFQIRVNASYRGNQASIVVHQSNAVAAAGASGSQTAHAGISGKTIGIILGVVAAGAVGAALGLKGGGSSTPSTQPVSTPTGSITGTGNAVLGPPK